MVLTEEFRAKLQLFQLAAAFYSSFVIFAGGFGVDDDSA